MLKTFLFTAVAVIVGLVIYYQLKKKFPSI